MRCVYYLSNFCSTCQTCQIFTPGYRCRDTDSLKIEVIGRNPAMERIAASVFPESVSWPTAPGEDEAAIPLVGESDA